MNSIIQSKKEIWKDVKDYEGLYQVSNYGNVKRIKDNYIFKQNKNSRGYRIITFTKNKKEKSVSVHRIVAETFISNPNNLSQINHIDGDKMNNKVDNLEWCTQSENMKHAYKTGLEIKKGKKVKQYDLEGNYIKTWNKMNEAEKEMNITHGKISQVCRGKQKTAYGYIWRYCDE